MELAKKEILMHRIKAELKHRSTSYGSSPSAKEKSVAKELGLDRGKGFMMKTCLHPLPALTHPRKPPPCLARKLLLLGTDLRKGQHTPPLRHG